MTPIPNPMELQAAAVRVAGCVLTAQIDMVQAMTETVLQTQRAALNLWSLPAATEKAPAKARTAARAKPSPKPRKPARTTAATPAKVAVKTAGSAKTAKAKPGSAAKTVEAKPTDPSPARRHRAPSKPPALPARPAKDET